MDSLTKSLMNPSHELLFMGGVTGIVIGIICIVIGLLLLNTSKRKKVKRDWSWWIVGAGSIAIFTGISTILRG